MLFTFKKLLNHYASATLIDVLHSPFVFELYNSCFKKKSRIQLPTKQYTQSGYSNKRVAEVVAKLQLRFPKHIVITQLQEAPINLPFILIPELAVFPSDIDQLLSKAHNDSFLVVYAPYASETTEANWKLLIALANATAAIDLFFVGLIFKRAEQRKQVFKLRLF